MRRGRACKGRGLFAGCAYSTVNPLLTARVCPCIPACAGAGVVDEDYRGEVGVVLFNHADTPFPGGWDGRAG